MRRGAALVVSLLSAQMALAQLPQPWKNWEYSASINADPSAASRLVAVVVPASVTARAARGWKDLRVIDTQGREIPYVLRARAGGSEPEWRPVRVLEPSVAPGAFTQSILDAGLQARVHNSARLHIDNPEDFLTWVEVAVSDDAREWRILRGRAPVFRLRNEGMGENTEVTYPDSTARYVRLRLLDGSKRYRMGAGELGYEATISAELVASGITLVTGASPAHRSVWVSTAPVSVPAAEVRFETSATLFDRPVTVETSDDGKQWRRLASGEIYRMRERGEPRESLSLRIPESSAADWRVTVYNHDDAALSDLRPTLNAIPRRVVFMAEPGQQYQLIYGNARADAPNYELGRLTDGTALDGATPAAVMAEQRNTTYADPAPWTERHPVVLWVALAAAVTLVGLFALRSLRTS